MADVAQLVEPRFVVPVVVSSSLIVRPRFFKCPIWGIFCGRFRLEPKVLLARKLCLKAIANSLRSLQFLSFPLRNSSLAES